MLLLRPSATSRSQSHVFKPRCSKTAFPLSDIMFTQLLSLSLAGMSLAQSLQGVDPSVNIEGYSTTSCRGNVTVSYQITKPQTCVTFGSTFTSANVTTSNTTDTGCTYSFFTGKDCDRQTYYKMSVDIHKLALPLLTISSFTYPTKESNQCEYFNGKQIKSAVLDCSK